MEYMYVADNGDLHMAEFYWDGDVMVVTEDTGVSL
jgi:hypothetical protein